MESDLIIALSRFLGRIYRAHRHISFQINVIALNEIDISANWFISWNLIIYF